MAITVPPMTTPNGAGNVFDISGPNLVASNGTSSRDCTKAAGPGRHCIAGTNTGLACLFDAGCGGLQVSCALDANCFFSAPQPVPADALSLCIVDVVQTDAGGVINVATGSVSAVIPLSSRVYLTVNSTSPCPKCVSGTCDYGPGNDLLGGK